MERDEMEREARELLEFAAAGTAPFQVVEESAKRLRAAGFCELDRADTWELTRGGRYFVRVFGSTLLAFTVGEAGPLRLAAAHTDFPCFRLKSRPGLKRGGYGVLNVEPYGGMMLRTWLDRPLSLAGKVALRTADPFAPEVRLVDFRRPLFTIPSLAIHMDHKVNTEGALNAQKDMLPLAGLVEGEVKEDFFLAWLAGELGREAGDVLSYELSLYPAEEGCTLGLAGELVSAPRLDNLTSVKACLDGLIASENAAGVRLIALFDNEEVGSRTKQGAGSLVLAETLKRIYSALGEGEDALARRLAEGFMLSCDVAHAHHPTHEEKSDPALRPVLGGGVVLKQAASQSYAGDAEAVATVRALAERAGIPWQAFANRSDSRGGSTLGSIASALVPVRTMDVGVPILAMHSARETMAAADQVALRALITEFLA